MKETSFSKRQQYWQSIRSEQRASGLNVMEFCQQRGIPASSFYSGTSRLKESSKKEAQFIRVEETKSAEPMRVVFASGVAFHFSETPAPEWLVELMKLVS